MGQVVLRTKAYPHVISEDHKSSDWRSGAYGKGFTLFILSRVIVDSWNYLDYYRAIPAHHNPLPRSYREHLVSGGEELRDRSLDYVPKQLVEGRLRVSGKRQSTRWTTYGHA